MKEWKKVLEQDFSHLAQEVRDDIERPCVIFLEGPLGAGKTTFVSAFMGKKVQSPTYNLLIDYDQYVHGDFYRLEQEQDLITLELPIVLEQKEIFFLEWGEKWLESLLAHVPEHFQYFKLAINPREDQPDLRDVAFYSVRPYH